MSQNVIFLPLNIALNVRKFFLEIYTLKKILFTHLHKQDNKRKKILQIIILYRQLKIHVLSRCSDADEKRRTITDPLNLLIRNV